jgi:hypothetical protein
VTRPDLSFIEEMESLQDAYLAHDDPIMQSGYFGGREHYDPVCPWLERLAGWVRPGGRLIIGSYRSRSQPIGPADVSAALEECGFAVIGTATGGDPANSNFAWVGV